MIRVIAEAGNARNDVEWAIDAAVAAANAGVWGYKVQMYPPHLAAVGAPRYDRLPGPGSQDEAFSGALPYKAWRDVFDAAIDLGLEAFASVWDERAIDACEDYGLIDWYKIGSADITHLRLLDAVGQTGRNVILSTGASTFAEVQEAVYRLSEAGAKGIVLMACTLSYPCEPQDAALWRIPLLIELTDWYEGPFAVGYSDHTREIETGGYAVTAGATMLEKHFTITPGMGGDHDFALDEDGMRAYRIAAEHAATLVGVTPSIGWSVLPSETDARLLARRSLHAITNIPKGQSIHVGVNARFQRPAAGGIAANEWGPWAAKKDIPAGAQISHADVFHL